QMNDDDVLQTDDDPSPPDDDPTPEEGYEMVDVQILLPDASQVELSTSTLVSLGMDSPVDTDAKGSIPLNNGKVEVGYLLDADNRVLLAGLISGERKEISVETTAELMVYYGLSYHLLPESAKSAFLKSIGQTPGFSNFVEEVQTLFENNPLLYSEGGY